MRSLNLLLTAMLAGVSTIALAAPRDEAATSSTTSAASAARSEADADRWAQSTEAQMTDDERFQLLHGISALPIGPFATAEGRAAWPADVVFGAGHISGIDRFNIPAIRETDASLGVTNPAGARKGDGATALPAAIVLGSTFDPALARAAGTLVGREARSRGFNVLLGGGVNLMRDPRNGRNFEYYSEDPLVSGELGGAAIAGSQTQGVVSTVKHLSLNANETNRHVLDAIIDPAAHRESDLLAFQIAIERGKPGSLMCAYNLVNGAESCGNGPLLNDALKRDWQYKGWVMSDWGAVDHWNYANLGLDQQSGEHLDKQVWFDKPLRQAVADGKVSRARLSDMVRRILRSMYLYAGAGEKVAPAPTVDLAAHDAITLDVARKGIVLLKNDDGILPLAASAKKIAMIGGQAHMGVPIGGGSSPVTPVGGWPVNIPYGGEGRQAMWRTAHYLPSAPLTELRKLRPDAEVTYNPGYYVAEAAALAKRSDLVVIVATRYEAEGFDIGDLSLGGGQDEMIAAVAAVNPNVVVVLETGNPAAMPWRDKVKGVVQAWYPGQQGGRAIAEILTGAVNPSGRLPISWPASLDQLPRPTIPGFDAVPGTPTRVEYQEGADVGYRWYAAKGLKPLYPFGYGLSLTQFSYAGLNISGGSAVTAEFTVTNTGQRAGADIPQLYLLDRAGKPTQRLIGYQRIELKPGETRKVRLTSDPRIMADYLPAERRWSLPGGTYRIGVGSDAATIRLTAGTTIASRRFGR